MKAEGTGTEAPGRRHLKGGVGPSGSSKSEAEKIGRVWEEGMLVETLVGICWDCRGAVAIRLILLLTANCEADSTVQVIPWEKTGFRWVI